MWQLIRDGGPIMWLLAVAGGLAGIIFIERFFHFHRAQIRVDDFLKGIYNIIKRGNIVEAASICEETPGPVAQIVRMAVLHHSEGREDMQKAITEAALAEIPRLERNMNLLATVAKITPLLGLLGTVLGMLDLLQLLQQNLPLVHSTDLFRGLWHALVVTAFSLAIAIPSYAGYNFLIGRVESIVLDMEKASVEIAAFFTKQSVANKGKGA